MTSPATNAIRRDDWLCEAVGDVEVGTYSIAFDLRRDDEPEGPPLLWRLGFFVAVTLFPTCAMRVKKRPGRGTAKPSAISSASTDLAPRFRLTIS